MQMLRHPAAHALSHSNVNSEARSLGRTFANIVAEKHPIAMIKLPIPPLLITAYTAKTTKKKQTSDERRALHKELSRARDRTRVNIGAAFPRWRELRKQKRIKSDAELAIFLLDRYDASASPTKSLPAENRRTPSMEIIVDIDEEDLTGISDIDQAVDGMCSPAEDMGEVSEEEETTEGDSFCDDSDDEDYMPPSHVQTSSVVKVKKSLNAVQSMSKEDAVPEAPTGEPGGKPAVADEIQVFRKPKKKYICPKCGKELPRYNALKRHLVIHSGKRPFKCFICGRGFTQDGNLKTHMKVHKGELHKWTLVQEKRQLKEAPVTAHICGDCGMDFPEKRQLEEHRESHKKPYACPDCGKTFKRENSVEIHQRIHSGDPPFRCSECGRTCGTAHSLKKHEAIHTGQKNFHCDQCGRSFLHHIYLKLHLNTHTGEKPHLCSVCGKSYSRAGTLKNHLRVHTGEKPYTCEKCGKGFRFSQTYQAHLKIHDKTPKPPTKPLGRPRQQFLEGNLQNNVI